MIRNVKDVSFMFILYHFVLSPSLSAQSHFVLDKLTGIPFHDSIMTPDNQPFEMSTSTRLLHLVI